ncbi:hypothetical protein [Roseivirga misakiensis]|nr:hypothetical protein [Roseivirga misakiensis]
MKYNKLLLFVLLAVICSSCATIINKPNQNIKLRANQETKLIVQNDTLNAPKGETINFSVLRKRPFDLGVLKNGEIQTLSIETKTPTYYWANAWTYGIGFVVDEISKDKLIYPNRIYLDLSENQVSYLPYFPMSEERLKLKNQISITPTALVGFYHPGIEVGYQRLLGQNFALQANYRHMLSANNEFARNASGFRVELNPKFYFRNEEKSRIYSSLSLEFLRKDHDAEFSFSVPENFDDDDFSNDIIDEILPVEKRFFSITPRIGIEHYLSDRLVLDAFFGIGLRYRETRVLGVNPNYEFFSEDDWFMVRYDSNRPSNRLGVNFDMNFRISWVF